MNHTFRTTIRKILPGKAYFLLQLLFFKITRIFYFGKNVYCPWCKSYFSKFPVLENFGPIQEYCPGCGCLGRHRALWFYLNDKQIFNHKKSFKLLHISPEYLIQKELKKQFGKTYLSIDLSSPIAMQKADISNLSFEDNSFDLIICSHVLQQVTDDKKAVSELYRVLKNKGKLLLYIWIRMDYQETIEGDKSWTMPERTDKLGHPEHLRCYGKDFINTLEQTGFDVKMERFDKRFSQDDIRKFGLYPKEDYTFICKKI